MSNCACDQGYAFCSLRNAAISNFFFSGVGANKNKVTFHA